MLTVKILLITCTACYRGCAYFLGYIRYGVINACLDHGSVAGGGGGA